MNLLDMIIEDWQAHDRDWTRPGFRAVVFCRYGQWCQSIPSKILRAPLLLLYGILSRRARNVYGIELPYTVKLGRRVLVNQNRTLKFYNLTANALRL